MGGTSFATVAFKPPRHSFEQATPTGKFPVIEDGALVMFESGAILEYLIEKYGKGRLAPQSAAPTGARICNGSISPRQSRRCPSELRLVS
jgi:glutathione S-transferase